MIYQKFGKRFLDFNMAVILLLLLIPVFLLISVLIRITLGHPVIFSQIRPGLGEKLFTLYKFRTMKEIRDYDGKLLPDSKRLTKLGKFLRSTSLDELPELWNILRGDMGLVGPRPLLVSYLPFYTNEEKLRHTVRPGLTGLAQINGRNHLDWDSRLRFDVQYARQMSFTLDMKIVFRTLLKVLKREGFAVIDQGSLKDLHIERGEKQITITNLKYDDFLPHKAEIKELLIELYESNFQVSHDNSVIISDKKIELLESFLQNGSAVLFGAFKDTTFIGFVWIYRHDYFGEIRYHINQFAVESRFRGMGIGRRLLEEAQTYAFKEGAAAMDLVVTKNNKAAVNLYEKLGFTIERCYLIKKLP